MKQLTIRGFDDELEGRLRELSTTRGISLNQAALLLMRKGAGISEPHLRNVVGSSLDDLIGTWTEAEEQEFLRSVEAFDEVDEEMWR